MPCSPSCQRLAATSPARGRGWRPDVVHAHYWMSGVASLDAAAQLRVPLVQTFHALGATKRRHQGSADTSPQARRWWEPALASSVAAVVATSADELEELRSEGARPRLTTIVPCGVDTTRFTPLTVRPGPARRVVSVGRLVVRKGVDDVIRTLPQLPEAHLVIAGGSTSPEDEDAGRLRSLAARLEVSDRVELIGPVDHEDVPALLRSADVVACVPWYEPFGMVALEAMACGVPVVASSVGGLRHLVVDQVTGLHVPPRDPPESRPPFGRSSTTPTFDDSSGSVGRSAPSPTTRGATSPSCCCSSTSVS